VHARNRADAKIQMQQIIDDRVDFNLVFAYNDVMAKGAHSVAKENGIENKFYLVSLRKRNNFLYFDFYQISVQGFQTAFSPKILKAGNYLR
jgi:DNA-binding LacI/PurR family transcriptional regulator